MDALFGLPRKKAAGNSLRDSLHGDIFFGNQTAVDEFVADSGIHRHNTLKVSIIIRIMVLLLIIHYTFRHVILFWLGIL